MVYILSLVLLPALPARLEELFLCLNEYTTVSASTVPCPTLRLLHITDNNLQDWAEVRKIGPMFPGLETLVMSNCNLSSIQDSEEMLRRLFPNLRSINLHNSGINQSRVYWGCVLHWKLSLDSFQFLRLIFEVYPTS